MDSFQAMPKVFICYFLKLLTMCRINRNTLFVLILDKITQLLNDENEGTYSSNSLFKLPSQLKRRMLTSQDLSLSIATIDTAVFVTFFSEKKGAETLASV